MPLMAAHPLALAQLPAGSGVYRLALADSADRLCAVGWDDVSVRAAVERLSRQVHLPVAPFDDVSGDARQLWQLRRGGAKGFVVSGAACTLQGPEREKLIELYTKGRVGNAYEAASGLFSLDSNI